MSDLEDIKEIINNSGNSFHCKVTEYFKSKGWHTLISPYYMDSTTNKPREIDLVVEKAFPYSNSWNSTYGSFNIKLFIECKYIPQKVVFWFDDKDRQAASLCVTSNTPLPEQNAFTDKHHYLSTNSKVAKLFAGETNKNLENEVIYKALNQSLNAMVYNKNSGSIIPERLNRIPNILASIELPVILCNSFINFYAVDMLDLSAPKSITENFQLEINYAYMDNQHRHQNEYFLIDVVEYNQIDDLLMAIDGDIQAISTIYGDV